MKNIVRPITFKVLGLGLSNLSTKFILSGSYFKYCFYAWSPNLVWHLS